MAVTKVLIVDDSLAERANLKAILEDAGCQVAEAKDGKEAVTKASEEKPHIIFMDIVMEEMDGYEATRAIVNDNVLKSTPVIFVSSKKQKADRVWAKMQGGKELISKPYTPEQILAQLKIYGQ